ncbi:Hypothetical_protein [Hexamita inflata]|uniref:Hypothetical_protein n=1 Tax=Hexamita inflata TaxID=28002 RepID=A0AA86RJD0_9EUKA|nr:Hypothetical protein HINF_LOCUS65337 [Hexamita inflata]
MDYVVKNQNLVKQHMECINAYILLSTSIINAFVLMDILNKTKCIKIVESINNVNNLLNGNNNDQIQLLDQQIENLGNTVVVIDQSIMSNITEIKNAIVQNISKQGQKNTMKKKTKPMLRE